jgi:uncharacterized protein (TIGR02452 family)
MSTLDRGKAARQGQEAVEIIHAGRYTAADGRTVFVRDDLAKAIDGTVSYPPDAALPAITSTGFDTHIEVTNETTLSAARRVVADGLNPVALNFASAKHPGGGFLGGARAQEESLCRSSGLYACIVNDAMYRAHAPTRGGFYTNYAIYSPGVPVFRDDDGDLLAEPYRCAFVTSPAVNAGTYLKDGGKQQDVTREMRDRIDKVLTIMAGHGHNAAVLGAWGCGVFRNYPEVIADLFREALMTRFAGAFRRVVFAVLDWSEERRFIGPFERRFTPSR